MTFFQAILLGIIQGLTEFLPISSTAHLLIGQKLMNLPATETMFAFLVIIQLGTVLSLFFFFGKDLWAIIKAVLSSIGKIGSFNSLPQEAKLGWYILLASIPALIAGFFLRDLVQHLFSKPLLESSIRLLTAAFFMTLAEYFGKRTRSLVTISWLDALLIGIMQIISVFPGASRSGTTISAGLLRNLDRPSAARFAFLMSVPVMLAAGGYEFISIMDMPGLAVFLPMLIVGFLVAALVGWLAIRWFMDFLGNHALHLFSIYCLITGSICLVISFF